MLSTLSNVVCCTSGVASSSNQPWSLLNSHAYEKIQKALKEKKNNDKTNHKSSSRHTGSL